MSDCSYDDFRSWHQSRVNELYAGTSVAQELHQARENFMAQAGWLCCKEASDE